MTPFGAVVIVASLGGLAAVSTVLSDLPTEFPTPVYVMQHGRRGDHPERLALLLARHSRLPVRTAADKQPLESPGVNVVPHGHGAIVDSERSLRLVEVDHMRPGDAMLVSVAEVLGPAAVAVVLTGMLSDGAAGVRAVKRQGGRVLVEDPSTARAGGMPSSAIATGCVDFVLPLRRIGGALVALAMAPGGADLLAVPTPSWATLQP